MQKYALLLCTFILASGIGLVEAQDAISITTTFLSGNPSTAEGYIYENAQQPVTALSTVDTSYAVSSLADHVFVRRNNVNPNQSSTWYASSNVGTNLAGAHQNSYSQMLLSNTLLGGSDNTFANGASGSTIGNIERLDFTWNSPLTVSNALAFAVFDRGVATLHDSFAIAAITAIDGSGNPTEFGLLLRVAAGWGGATNPIADQNYRLFRYNNGDTIDTTTDSTGTATQGVGARVVTAIDLGLVSGMQIFGYALMAADVTATDSSQLLDWMNPSFYPTTTDGTTGGGGIDLAAVNGIAFVAVPEPATWVSLLIGAVFLAYMALRAGQRLRR